MKFNYPPGYTASQRTISREKNCSEKNQAGAETNPMGFKEWTEASGWMTRE